MNYYAGSSAVKISKKRDIAIYESSQVINRETYQHIERLTDLAPLHNSKALDIMKMYIEEIPDAVNMACFDSQFH